LLSGQQVQPLIVDFTRRSYRQIIQKYDRAKVQFVRQYLLATPVLADGRLLAARSERNIRREFELGLGCSRGDGGAGDTGMAKKRRLNLAQFDSIVAILNYAVVTALNGRAACSDVASFVVGIEEPVIKIPIADDRAGKRQEKSAVP
jgi:hypothetical protein